MWGDILIGIQGKGAAKLTCIITLLHTVNDNTINATNFTSIQQFNPGKNMGNKSEQGGHWWVVILNAGGCRMAESGSFLISIQTN